MHSNIEIVHAAGRLFDAQDWAGLHELLHPSVVSYWPEDWPESGVFAGRQAVVGHFRRLREGWADSRLTAEASAENGDWVAIRWRQLLETRRQPVGDPQSDDSEEFRISAAYRIEGGQISEIRFHWHFADARAVTGAPA